CPVLRYLFSLEGWILKHFALCVALLFGSWATGFFLYSGLFGHRIALDKFIQCSKPFTNGVSCFLRNAFFIFFGAGMYLTLRVDPGGLHVVWLAAVLFGIPSVFFGKYASVRFVPNRILDKSAPVLAVLCTIIALAAALYG